jgi:hypothetical protein
MYGLFASADSAAQLKPVHRPTQLGSLAFPALAEVWARIDRTSAAPMRTVALDTASARRLADTETLPIDFPGLNRASSHSRG